MALERIEEIISALSPQQIRGYLASRGWIRSRRIRDVAAYYVHSDYPNRELLVPEKREIGDWNSRVYELIRDIADIESLRPEWVCSLISLSGFDVIRITVAKGSLVGTVGLQSAVSAATSAKDLITAAACSAVDPRLYYGTRKPNQVYEYLSKVKFGQTDIGSFVFNILAPVTPNLQDDLDFGDDPLSEDPFERKVTRLLASALARAEEASVEQSAGRFAEFVQEGVSVNFLEAISGIAEAAQGADIDIKWSVSRRAPHQQNRFSIDVQTASVMREAARRLKTRSTSETTVLQGWATALHREVQSDQGEITLLVFVDDAPRRVRVRLASVDYTEIIQAHAREQIIQVEGELIRDGAHLRLENPRNLKIINTPIDE